MIIGPFSGSSYNQMQCFGLWVVTPDTGGKHGEFLKYFLNMNDAFKYAKANASETGKTYMVWRVKPFCYPEEGCRIESRGNNENK